MEFETWVVMLAGQELFLGQRNLAGSLNFENPPTGCWEHLHDCAIGFGFDSAFWWQRKELQTQEYQDEQHALASSAGGPFLVHADNSELSALSVVVGGNC